jgi:hypothetical protein
MISHKITLKLVRSFGIGFTIRSPSLNGFSMDIQIACISLDLWSRGQGLFAFRNYWNAW